MSNYHLLTGAVDFSLLVPQASSSGTRTSAAFVDVGSWRGAVLLLSVGAIAAGGTLNVQLKQATDAAGTGAKNLTGATLTPIVDAGGSTPNISNSLYAIEFRTTQLDLANGFTFVGCQVVASGAASVSGAVLLRHDKNYGPEPFTSSLTQRVVV